MFPQRQWDGACRFAPLVQVVAGAVGHGMVPGGPVPAGPCSPLQRRLQRCDIKAPGGWKRSRLHSGYFCPQLRGWI